MQTFGFSITNLLKRNIKHSRVKEGMSLYNLICGENPIASILLKIIECTKSDFGRYRDIYVGSSHIVVYTRDGGNNRKCYAEDEFGISRHPKYNADEDCGCSGCVMSNHVPNLLWYAYDRDDFDDTYLFLYSRKV